MRPIRILARISKGLLTVDSIKGKVLGSREWITSGITLCMQSKVVEVAAEVLRVFKKVMDMSRRFRRLLWVRGLWFRQVKILVNSPNHPPRY